LRQFAGLWLLFFGGLALWHGLVRGNLLAGLLLAAAALGLGSLGLVKPRAVRLVFVGWMVVAFPVGWAVSHVVLGLAFYGVFTPVGLVFRLVGRDALGRRRHPAQESYWAPKPAASGAASYFRQF
jgi:hypothetical protein